MSTKAQPLFFIIALLLTSSFSSLSCTTKPTKAPTTLELKQVFYSLSQSNYSGYKCDVQSQLLTQLSDMEMDRLFQEQFLRTPSLYEKSLLRKVKWTVINSNQTQTVTSVPDLSQFPTEETKELVRKTTALLTIINKVLTLTYLETFADRPDLSQIQIEENFFQVFNKDQELIAELSFNQNTYRIFFGSAPPAENQMKDHFEVTLAPLGSMKIPKMILLMASGKSGKFFPHFEVAQGFPQIRRIDILLPEFGKIKSPYLFEKCEYLKSPEIAKQLFSR